MPRRNFSSRVKLAAFERAKGQCERCTAKLFPGNIIYDHRIPDALGGEPTVENCEVICRSCDREKTPADQRAIAKAKRVQIKHIGARIPRNTLPFGRNDLRKKTIAGLVVDRATGMPWRRGTRQT
jgi:5-methylcytosine-specific restriction protein A